MYVRVYVNPLRKSQNYTVSEISWKHMHHRTIRWWIWNIKQSAISTDLITVFIVFYQCVVFVIIAVSDVSDVSDMSTKTEYLIFFGVTMIHCKSGLALLWFKSGEIYAYAPNAYSLPRITMILSIGRWWQLSVMFSFQFQGISTSLHLISNILCPR